jgi:hypothetical protein
MVVWVPVSLGLECPEGSRDSPVGLVTMFRAGLPRSPARDFSLLPNFHTGCGADRNCYLPVGTEAYYFHPAPRLQMSGDMPPFHRMPSWYAQGQFYLTKMSRHIVSIHCAHFTFRIYRGSLWDRLVYRRRQNEKYQCGFKMRTCDLD